MKGKWICLNKREEKTLLVVFILKQNENTVTSTTTTTVSVSAIANACNCTTSDDIHWQNDRVEILESSAMSINDKYIQ